MEEHADEAPGRTSPADRSPGDDSVTTGGELSIRDDGLPRADHKRAHVFRPATDRRSEMIGAVQDVTEGNTPRRRGSVLQAQQVVHVLRE